MPPSKKSSKNKAKKASLAKLQLQQKAAKQQQQLEQEQRQQQQLLKQQKELEKQQQKQQQQQEEVDEEEPSEVSLESEYKILQLSFQPLIRTIFENQYFQRDFLHWQKCHVSFWEWSNTQFKHYDSSQPFSL